MFRTPLEQRKFCSRIERSEHHECRRPRLTCIQVLRLRESPHGRNARTLRLANWRFHPIATVDYITTFYHLAPRSSFPLHCWTIACAFPPLLKNSFACPHRGFVHPGHLNPICMLVGPTLPSACSFRWFETMSARARMKMGESFRDSARFRLIPSCSVNGGEGMSVFWMGIARIKPADRTHLVSLLLDLDIKLIQRLDMVAGKSDRDQQDVLLAQLGQPLDRIRRLRTLPSGRSDLGLPRQTVRVRESELGHHGVYGRGDFGDVRVTSAG
jgi:hypothetical protein